MLSMGGGDGGGSELGSEYEFHYEDVDVNNLQDGELGSLAGGEYEEEDGDDEDGDDEDDGEDDGEEENDDDEVDAFDAQENDVEIDPSAYNDDEAYARALQEEDERNLSIQLMTLAGINDCRLA